MPISNTQAAPHSNALGESGFLSGLELLPVMAWLSDPSGHCLYANPQWLAFTGLTQAQARDQGWHESVHGGDREDRCRTLAEAARQRTPYVLDYRLRRADGTFGWVSDRVTPLWAADGSFAGYLGTTLDISTHRQTEDALLASEALNSGILDSSQDCIKLLDTEGHLLSMSAGGQRLLGIADITPYLQRSWCDIWPAAYRSAAHAAVASAAAGATGKFIGHCPSVDGTPKWWDVVITPVPKTPGTKPRLLAISRDITEQKLAEEAIKRSESEYRAIFDLSAVGIGQTDCVSGRFLKVNRKYCELVGYTAEELDGLGFMDLTPADERGHNAELYQALLRGEIADYTLVKRLIRKDGKTVWVQVTATAIRDEAGVPTSLVAVVEDISARKSAEAALAESERAARARADELRTVLATVPAIVLVTRSADGSNIIGSEAAYRTLRWPSGSNLSKSGPADGVPSTFEVYKHGKRLPIPDLPVQRAARGEPMYDQELELRFTDGDVRHIIGNAETLRNADGSPRGSVAAFIDVTDRKRSELALVQRTQELEAANRELESFSYSVSHDLRGPLRAINGFSGALQEDCADALDEVGRGYLARIHNATLRMSELIDGLLGLSRVFRAELELQDVDLSALAAEIVRQLHESETERNVEVGIEPGLIATGDATLLRLLLQNVLGNAWKFTGGRPDARILFRRERHDRREVFVIRDNGVGFEIEYAHKLFQPFERLHGEKEFQGTGIGLATVRRIVQRHGGEVWAEGEKDAGAAIFFTLG